MLADEALACRPHAGDVERLRMCLSVPGHEHIFPAIGVDVVGIDLPQRVPHVEVGRDLSQRMDRDVVGQQPVRETHELALVQLAGAPKFDEELAGVDAGVGSAGRLAPHKFSVDVKEMTEGPLEHELHGDGGPRLQLEALVVGAVVRYLAEIVVVYYGVFPFLSVCTKMAPEAVNAMPSAPRQVVCSSRKTRAMMDETTRFVAIEVAVARRAGP